MIFLMPFIRPRFISIAALNSESRKHAADGCSNSRSIRSTAKNMIRGSIESEKKYADKINEDNLDHLSQHASGLTQQQLLLFVAYLLQRASTATRVNTDSFSAPNTSLKLFVPRHGKKQTKKNSNKQQLEPSSDRKQQQQLLRTRNTTKQQEDYLIESNIHARTRIHTSTRRR